MLREFIHPTNESAQLLLFEKLKKIIIQLKYDSVLIAKFVVSGCAFCNSWVFLFHQSC